MLIQLIGGKGGGGESVLIPHTATTNDVYYASNFGADGFDVFTVAVPAPVINSLSITPSISPQTITATGGVDGYAPISVSAVDSTIDANIAASNIVQGVSILGVAGSAVELDGDTVSLSPSTSQQTVTPTAPHNGFTSVTVDAVTSSIDANIVAGNIKDGVTILGVTGSYQGSNALRVAKGKDANNKLTNSGTAIIDLDGCTDIGDYVLYYAYKGNTNISGTVNFSSLTQISGASACCSTFEGCTGLAGADLSSVVVISGDQACSSTFNSCVAMTSADLSSLTTISGGEGCWAMFINCTHLTSALLSSLSSITGARACRRMFANTALTSLSFPALTSNSFGSYTNQFNEMLLDVTGCTVHFPSNLQAVIGSWQDVIDGFGGINTTVLFDLPATE